MLKGDQAPVVLIGHSIGMGSVAPCTACIPWCVLLVLAVGCRSFRRRLHAGPAGAHIALQNVRHLQERGSGIKRIHKVGCRQAAAARPPPLLSPEAPLTGQDTAKCKDTCRLAVSVRCIGAGSVEASSVFGPQVVALMPFLQFDPQSWRQWGLAHLAAWPRLGGAAAAGVALLPAPLLRRFVDSAGDPATRTS